MKRIMATVLAVAIAATGLVGCGSAASTSSTPASGSTASSADTTKDDGKVDGTINVWVVATESDPNDVDMKWINLAMDKMEEEYPDVKVELSIFGGDGGADYRAKLSAEIATGNVPDVFTTWPGSTVEPFVKKGALKPLNDIIDSTPELKEIYIESQQPLFTFDGNTYGLSLSKDSKGLFYNRQMFTDRGLTPPTTIDELLKVSKAFQEDGITPIALGNSVVWTIATPYEVLLAENVGLEQYQANYSDKIMDFKAESAVKAGETLRMLSENGVFGKDYDGIEPAEAIATFKEGGAAMFLQGAWQASGLVAAMGENVGYIAFPTVSGEKTDAIAFSKGYALSADAKCPEAAEAFFKVLYSKEILERMAEDLIVCFDVEYPAEISSLKKDLVEVSNSGIPVFGADEFFAISASSEYRNTIQALAAGLVEVEPSLSTLQDYIDMTK